MHTYILGIVFLEHNKNSSAPPHSTNNSTRMMITDPSTPPTMFVCMFISLPAISSEDPVIIEVGVVNESDLNTCVEARDIDVNASVGTSFIEALHLLSVS